ncbi:hypothetical protein C7S16_1385 [Burkholderia thailandensis]|uniref:Uncharacterized protein n=1 Tax=Burkholderia thailandensis TaxID=57975 RepID=A0AAW9D664_BURTH|nr:hypothetical protein [Burkholderia thailandensis]MDW9257400.1 hypothetical protein [Burkholderia thailandensis]
MDAAADAWRRPRLDGRRRVRARPDVRRRSIRLRPNGARRLSGGDRTRSDPARPVKARASRATGKRHGDNDDIPAR